MSTSPQQHKRANTYEGPQMGFKFPSEEDLQRTTEEEIPLEGPRVKPFVEYVKEKAPEMSPTPAARTAVRRSKDMNYFAHPQSMSSTYSTTSSQVLVGGSNYSSEASIPTQSNATTQITCRSESMYAGASDVVLNRRTSVSRSGTVRRNTSVMQRRKLADSALKNGAMKRAKTVRVPSSESEDVSLYDRGMVKRSSAVKYTVGWLTRMKKLGAKIGKKFKKWRLVSLKKAFKFNRAKSVKKSKISMPLERDRAQSISELKRAIDDWDTPTDLAKLGSIKAPPPMRFRDVSASTSSLVESRTASISRVPPPLPPHRIASNISMQRLIEEQDKRMSSLGPLSEGQPALVDPMDQQFSFAQQQDEVLDAYPSHPPTVYDDEPGVTFDDDETLASDGFEDEEEEQELVLREYWGHFLRSVIAKRIETKLECHRLSQIPEPEQKEEIAEEMFGSLSDLDQGSSDFEGTMRDDESWTSMSSTDVSESDSLPSRSSRDYFSAYDGPVATPIEIMKYQLAYMSRYRDVVAGVKRSSTLPVQTQTELRHNSYEIQHPHHMRFLSVEV